MDDTGHRQAPSHRPDQQPSTRPGTQREGFGSSDQGGPQRAWAQPQWRPDDFDFLRNAITRTYK